MPARASQGFALVLTAFFLGLCALVTAHSWIDCTDYKINTSTDAQTYKIENCKARPRKWADHAGGGVLGADTGYNHQDFSCLYPMGSDNYTPQYPQATYKQGQRVCLAWPSKNHVAATCTNAYIPDGGSGVYMSSRGATSDPSSPSSWTQLADLGKNTPGKMLGEVGGGMGFQNCPLFCNNMDKTLCTGCFTIPATQPTGQYAFQWRWVFNPGTPYTTCWDALIVSSSDPNTPVDPLPVSSTSPSPTPAVSLEPLVGDSIRIATPPNTIAPKPTTITVNVQYSALGSRDIIVDLLQLPNYGWFGKAVKLNVPAGSGTATMTIQVQNNPPNGQYIIKPWIVEAGKGEANQGWLYELDRKEYRVAIQEQTVNPPSSDGVHIVNTASVLVLCAISAAILYLF